MSATTLEGSSTDIHRLAIPTPFAVGRVNTYLIDDDPLTLIDSGPNSGKALDELEQQLGARGREIEDLELIILTHQHLDHTGLAAILARRSGAQVAGIAPLAAMLADYSAQMQREDEFAAMMMLRHGIPEDVVHALRAVSAGFRGWGSRVELSRVIEDGETIHWENREMVVYRRPGHSPTDTVFHDPHSGVLIGGDHLLPHISSNPLIARAPDSPTEPSACDHGRRPQALVSYLASMAATREMVISEVLPGHGDPFRGHQALIDERFVMHERRARKISRLIAEGPLTAYEIAQSMWGNVAVTQAYLTLSEVLGHVDVLLNRGEVHEIERGGVIRFELI